jgi:hypothetical protein
LIPASVDLTAGQTPVCDQGLRPTCAAMAATAAHEYGRAGFRLSVEHLWSNTGSRGGLIPGGARLSVLRTAIVFDGQCEDTLWPYGGDTATAQPTPVPSIAYKADAATGIVGASIGALRSEIASGRPPVLVINPNAAFAVGGQLIDANLADAVDSNLHAVLAVAYDDGRAMVTVRNSWGTSWGNAGYANLTYNFIGLRGRAVMRVVV